MSRRSPREDGRTIVSDLNIPEMVKGHIGIYYAWTNPETGYTILFIYVYSDKNVAYGQILVAGRSDVDRIQLHGTQSLITMAITQPDAAASAAREGGLRPSGVIVDFEVVSDEV